MIIPTTFRVIIFFHCLSAINDELLQKALTVPQGYHTGTLIRFCVQRLLKFWKELHTKASFTDFSKETAPYMLLENSTCQLHMLSTRFESLQSLRQENLWWMLAVRLRVRNVWTLLHSIVRRTWTMRYAT